MMMNNLSVGLWEYCLEKGLHISAAHIPGKHNILADTASRVFHDAAEWMLSPQVFQEITCQFGKPEIDLFTSRLNKQVPIYESWKPDPESAFIDAMLISWSNKFIYLFPPFSMIWPALSKLEKDKVERAIFVTPRWSTQSLFPRIIRKAMAPPMIVCSCTLILPGTTKVHPLAPKLQLQVILCSWRDSR